MLSLDFEPGAARAVAMNHAMHQELALSLAYVWQASEPAFVVSSGPKERLLEALCKGVAYPATIFARYFEIVDAIIDEKYDEAALKSEAICALKPSPPGRKIRVLGEGETADETDRYLRLLSSEPTIGLSVPSERVAADFKKRLFGGLDLLRLALPQLSGELDALVREIVIVGGDETKPMQFDGGSHSQLWGSLFLNAQYHPDAVAVVEVLAHESAHSLLFGFCTHENLVQNNEDERFTSPLRVDPRPMEGIYHATYVSARMHWAMTKLSESPLLTDVERERARSAAKTDKANFEAGDAVVAQQAKLSPLGLGLMTGAREYMAAVV